MGLLSILRRVTVEPVLFIYMLAAFISFGTFQDLLYYKVCHLRYGNRDTCLNMSGDVLTYTQTHGSHWLLYINIALYVPSILVACYIGSWSDKHGRKIPMLMSGIFTLFGYLIYMLIAYYENSPIAYLLLANFVTGLGGGYIVLISSVMSYLADITVVEDRTHRVAILESMTFLGATLGPLVSGYLLVDTNHVYVFFFCLVCNSVMELFIIFRIEDTTPVQTDEVVDVLHGEEQVAPGVTRLNRLCNVGYMYAGLVTCMKEREERKHIYILVAILAFICIILASSAENYLIYLYVKDEPLSWNYLTFSQYLSLHTGLGTMMLLFGLPFMRRFFNLKDTTFVFMGLVSRAAGLTLLSLSTTTVMVFCVPVVALFAIFPAPCYRSMLSKLVDNSEHGKLFSMLATVENLSTLLGSAIFNNLYPVTRSVFHGLCFLAATAFVAVAFMLTSFSFIDQRRQMRRCD